MALSPSHTDEDDDPSDDSPSVPAAAAAALVTAGMAATLADGGQPRAEVTARRASLESIS